MTHGRCGCVCVVGVVGGVGRGKKERLFGICVKKKFLFCSFFFSFRSVVVILGITVAIAEALTVPLHRNVHARKQRIAAWLAENSHLAVCILLLLLMVVLWWWWWFCWCCRSFENFLSFTFVYIG